MISAYLRFFRNIFLEANIKASQINDAAQIDDVNRAWSRKLGQHPPMA